MKVCAWVWPLGLVFAWGWLVPQSEAAVIVVPNEFANLEGETANILPFGLSGVLETQVRYQQVYNNPSFSLFSGPQLITALLLRRDGAAGPGSVTYADIQIHLSTTTRSADGLSHVFADNIGADDTQVYRGSLTLTSLALHTQPTNPFDIRIGLQTPFLYDPQQGNLLLEIRSFNTNPVAGNNLSFDATGLVGDVVSRLVALNVHANSGSLSSVGLITAFEFQAPVANGVPAPTSFALGMLGLLCLSVVRWGRKKIFGSTSQSHPS